MTFKEKLQKERPECLGIEYCGGCKGCPLDYGYESDRPGSCQPLSGCTACWNREIPRTERKLFISTASLIDTPMDRAFREAGKSFQLTEHAKLKIGANVYDVLQKDLQQFVYKSCLNAIYGKPKINMPGIKEVIFNDPATIVIWADGEKTVVKCQNGEPYDPEKGLAMAISKRALGNKHEYYNTFKHWLKKCKPKKAPVAGISSEQAIEGIKKLAKAAKIGRRG